MMSGSDTVLFSLYVCLLGVLSLFAVHRLRLALAAGRMQKARAVSPPEWPCVLVQLPLYNERYVAERLIDAVAALDYPAGRLSIQVLDDSTDDTTVVVAGRCASAASPSSTSAAAAAPGSRRGRSRRGWSAPTPSSWQSSTPTSYRPPTSSRASCRTSMTSALAWCRHAGIT